MNPKNTIKIGVLGPFFLKSCCASRSGNFWTKKAKIYKFQLSFFAYFLLFQQQKTQTSAETPIFIVFLLTKKKENFQKINLNTEIEKQFLHPFLKKAIFR